MWQRVYVVLCFALVAQGITWRAAYDLGADDILSATENGCSRGVYGASDNKDSLTLLTCDVPGAEVFAKTDVRALLCVLELAEGASMDLVLATLKGDSKTEVLFQGRREIVIGTTLRDGTRPHMCCRLEFNGTVDNAIDVPVEAIIPQYEPNHPALDRARDSAAAPNELIVEHIKHYHENSVRHFVQDIATGPERNNLRITRNSYAIRRGAGGCADPATWACANNAVDDLVDELRKMFNNDAWAEITTDTFRTDMCDNVVLKMRGAVEPDEIVVSGAHLDSRNTGSGSGATGVAPGADDNASGSAVLLEMARVIAQRKIRFHYSVHFLWFCGEEQGLLGSRALANAYRDAGTTIIGMFNNDMIGYTHPPAGVTLSFMNRFATTWLSEACMAFTTLYVPDLRSAYTNACCSDQQSFFNAGFPAAGIFETPTNSVVYPEYHRTGDTYNNGLINYEQVWLFGKANFCCMMEFAVPQN